MVYYHQLLSKKITIYQKGKAMNKLFILLICCFTVFISCNSPVIDTEATTDNYSNEPTARNIGFPSGPTYPTVYEAENYYASSGIINYGTLIGSFDAGDYVVYNNINFDEIPSPRIIQMYQSVNQENSNQSLEIRLDAPNGPIIGYFRPQSTGSYSVYKMVQTGLNKYVNVTGSHKLVFKVPNPSRSGIINIESFRIMTLPVAPFNTTN
ncbi:carbohydrate-binding protein [Brucepastera parasyntrophica]|uniref:carbohydrate-binding protein n=1 Tax=Brucepastera parasyntrophica TaxID=2880008 RepID=UPI00210EA9E4|nr:carbohydrate-binding protein [Brucepastera parasyntrophica]ULQ59424.1 carbohydrate-binding protein [Brucepastera parasyntrophica]